MNITDLEQEQRIPSLLRLGFRPLFLLGAIFALLSIAIWIATLNGAFQFSPSNGALWWHGHEMLFGFTTAVIAGFLLTAVQTWTGIPSIKGSKLLILLSLWLLARVAFLSNLSIPYLLIALLDLSFLPLTGYYLAKPLIKISQYRNLVFIPLLVLMTIANTLTHLPFVFTSANFSLQLATQGMHAMVLLTTVLIALIGGRVIPMFTANGTKTRKVLPLAWLEKSSMLILTVIAICIIGGFTWSSNAMAALCLLASILHAYRSLRWRPWVSIKFPLVWVLHASMLFIPLGLFLMFLHFGFNLLSLSHALHAITVGAIGGMIIAMMSRVSLGHTGRMLKVSNISILSFVSIVVAALLRSFAIAFLPQYTTQLWLLSGIFWCISFACFLWVYLPILASPRVDGRPG